MTLPPVPPDHHQKGSLKIATQEHTQVTNGPSQAKKLIPRVDHIKYIEGADDRTEFLYFEVPDEKYDLGGQTGVKFAW